MAGLNIVGTSMLLRTDFARESAPLLSEGLLPFLIALYMRGGYFVPLRDVTYTVGG